MRGNGESIVWGLALEFAPATIFGSAAAFASATALSLPRFDLIPLSAGIGAFAISWLLLRRLGAGGNSLPLADFDQSDLEREMANLAEELMQAESQAADDRQLGELVLEDELHPSIDEELVLEIPTNEPEQESRVIRLFDPASETAGEMQARIDRHLRTTARPPLSDATQELHEALSVLRQSLR